MQYPVGSKWRKWDLHIHTLASYLWNGNAQRRKISEAEAVAAIDRINSVDDVSVFAIQDYWTFDGYKKIRRLLDDKDNDITTSKLILPGMELRVDAPTNYTLNIHVMLSDGLSDDELNDFRSMLKLALSNQSESLSDTNLIKLARTYSTDKANKHGYGDPRTLSDDELYLLGVKTAVIEKESLRDAVNHFNKDSIRAIVFQPYDTFDGLAKLAWDKHPVANTFFMQLAHCFETKGGSPIIDTFLHITTPQNAHFIENAKVTMDNIPKPSFRGSDARKYPDYGVFNNNPRQITWVKANPTFQGLLQVLNQPADRAFIGEEPEQLKRVRDNRTKYIHSLQINKTPDSTRSDSWFDGFDLEFNKGLVVIIGNRGMGKSALLDIIALAGRSKQNEDDFSFLNTKKFRDPRQNLAREFDAILTWEDKTEIDVNLNDFSRVGIEKVKYIPQQFLERICNEEAIREGGEFDIELKKVLFSHVSEEERLGKESLQGVLEFRNDAIGNSIEQKIDELIDINQQIIQLQKRQESSYRTSIQQKLDGKKDELDALVEPERVEMPEQDSETTAQIQELRDTILSLTDMDLANARNELRNHTLNRTNANNLRNELGTIKTRVQNMKDDYRNIATEIGLNIDELIRLEIDVQSVREKEITLANEIVQLETNIETINSKIEDARTQIATIQSEIDEEQQEYQQYLDDLANWERQKAQIIGDENTQNTIKWFEAKLAEIDAIPAKLKELESKRQSIVSQIYDKIKQLFASYEALMKPAQSYVDEQRTKSLQEAANTISSLEFGVRMELNPNFIDHFLDYINQGRTGPFHGIYEGSEHLKDIISRYDFKNFENSWEFASEILDGMNTAYPSLGQYEATKRQLRDSKSVEEFYEFLFSFKYLRPNYVFQLDGRDLTQLSPGERGMLLLIFYLLIDKEDCPLLIDQPDENLDNQAIETLLKPCVKIAKKRRQIFIVTHNPNVTIGCDAEQVIYAQKKENNEILYIPGAIEEPVINKAIVDIQEGTWPAFDKRGDTYIRVDD